MAVYKVQNLDNAILDTNQISNLKDRYILGEKALGKGHFACIYACLDRSSHELLACKTIAKCRQDKSSIKLEIDAMIKLSGHPNIVHLKAVYEDEIFVYLVMELCAGGELFEYIFKNGSFSESEARVIFKQLMEVVTYCHDNGVVHRDLKPENILLTTETSPFKIKLADFGLASYIEPGQMLKGTVGSAFYIAPEVLEGDYNQAADVWSAGVVLYILLCGVPPFFGLTTSEVFNAVRAANLEFPSALWDRISDSSKDLIRGMLCTDPSQRLTARQVLDHAWMKDSCNCSMQCLELDVATASTSSPFMTRAQDISFGSGCRSLFSSFLEVPPSPSFTSGDHLLPSSSGSSSLEFSTPVSLPSFSFFSPGLLADQQNCSFNFSTNISRADSVHQEETLLAAASDGCPSFGDVANKGEEEHKDAKSWVRNAGYNSSRRNNTIGVGEFDQLSLVAAESVIRWASCTHLPTASLRSSLVC